MINDSSFRTCCRHVLIAASLVGGGVAANGAAAQPAARENDGRTQLANARLVDVEQAFWTCDYLATVHGYVAFDAHLCSIWTDALRDRKFGGDFARLLAWWRENKPTEHERQRRGVREP